MRNALTAEQYGAVLCEIAYRARALQQVASEAGEDDTGYLAQACIHMAQSIGLIADAAAGYTVLGGIEQWLVGSVVADRAGEVAHHG